MMKLIVVFLLSGTAYAAGGDGPGALIAPAINLAILLGFVIYKIRKPVSDMFKNQAVEIKEKIESAAVKAKEAKMMMETQKKKMEGSEEEIKKMEVEAKETIEKFEADYKVSIDERVNKLKEDAGQKIEAEKKELLNELNSNLLDQVIAKAKDKLKNDHGLGEEATKKILQGVK